MRYRASLRNCVMMVTCLFVMCSFITIVSAAPVKIVYMPYFSTGDRGEIEKEIVRQFNEANPDIVVETVPTGNPDQITMWFATGVQLDVGAFTNQVSALM